jgi:hypothetical protein
MQWLFHRTLNLAFVCVCVLCLWFMLWYFFYSRLYSFGSGMTGEWWIGRIFEAIHRGLRNVRSRNLHIGTEENHEEVSDSIARVPALIRIGYVPGTGGDKFWNINLYGIQRIPVPMRYPKSEVTPSKNAQGLTPNVSTTLDACYFITSETSVCIVVGSGSTAMFLDPRHVSPL